mgnify:FL=1
MIVFTKIRYKNILSTGNSFTEIDLTRNKTTLIVGDNGAGKSTVLDALSFVLYGKPFRKINKPQLLNSINQRSLIVEIELETAGKSYKICRGIKPSLFEIYQNNKLINQTASVRDYQDLLEKSILKMNHKSFSQVVVLGSSTFVPFMQLSAAQRREVIEDLLDLQIFSTMNNLLKEKITQSKNDIREIQYQIDLLEEKIKLEREHQNTIVSDVKRTIDEKTKRIQGYKEDIRKENDSVSSYERQIGSLESGIRDQDKTNSRSDKIRTILEQLKKKIKKINKDIEFFKHYDNCPTCKQDITSHFKEEIVENRKSLLNETTQGLKELQSQKDVLEKRLLDIFDINSQISDMNENISSHNRNVQISNHAITQLNEEIANLNEKVNTTKNDSTAISELETACKNHQKFKIDLGEEQTLYRVGSEMLKDSGIKSRIIKQYVPVMNKLINHYLQQLGFFVQFELDENFTEKIKSRFRDEFSYESFSEGEKMRIDLSLLFTWRTIAKLRNSVSTNLLIMDEVFDSSLDNNGTEEFFKIIEELTTDTNTFIISHKGDVMIDKFRNIIRFEKQKNFSRIAA